MRRIVTLMAIVALQAASAAAHNINLNAGDCYTGSIPNQQVTLDCSNNAHAPLTLVATVELSAGIPQFCAAGAIIDFQFGGSAVPDWWRLDGAGCRSGSATAAWNMTSGGTCTSIWYPELSGGNPVLPIEQWQLGVGGANHIRYNGLCAVPYPYDLPQLDPLHGSNEWGIVSLGIASDRTTGAGACTGCSAGVCAVLEQVVLNYERDLGLYYTLTYPGTLGNYVVINSGGGSCGAVTPAKARTWGEIKSLYR